MRYDEYVKIISTIPEPNYKPIFNTKGKLIICLIEYRIMDEIKYVINAMLRVYKSSEIGFSIVYGNINKQFIESKYRNWKNIKLINTGDDNLSRETYSVMLKTPTFWENFLNWSHILIYQTDALILRRVDDIYFNYDYVGAPWRELNGWCKYNGGNGGFSLRSIKAMISACEVYRNVSKSKIPQNNEDGFFCRCDNLKFIMPEKSELHKAFAVEILYHPKPVGVHKLWWYLTKNNEQDFLEYIYNSYFCKKI